jgi:toxin FitB
MAIVVMDTDVTSHIIKGKQLPSATAHTLVGSRLSITFVTLAELLKWPVLRSWGQRRRAALDGWLSNVLILYPDDEVARIWGKLAANAVRRGRPRPHNDMWIAACCIRYDVPLATFNLKDFEDFASFEGLVLVQTNRSSSSP